MNAFARAYVECALWASPDNSDESGGMPFDRNCSIADIHPETLARMESDCRQFEEDNSDALRESGLSDSRAGHDFWLNRNGHGSGFWDEGDDRIFRQLSNVSKAFGTFDLYLGDDGKIYGS